MNTSDSIFLIDEREIIALILKYLRGRNFLETFLTLESESKVANKKFCDGGDSKFPSHFDKIPLESFEREVAFFRKLILEGNFVEAESSLSYFRKRLGRNYEALLFLIKRQRFFELIEKKPKVELLVELLKEIENLTTPEDFKSLCFVLTLKKITDHPDFKDWTVAKGRLTCFEGLRSFVDIEDQASDAEKPSLLNVFERLLFLELKSGQGYQLDQIAKYPLLKNISSDKSFQDFRFKNRIIFEGVQSEGSILSSGLNSNSSKRSGSGDALKNLAKSFVAHNDSNEREKNILMQSLQFFKLSEEPPTSEKKASNEIPSIFIEKAPKDLAFSNDSRVLNSKGHSMKLSLPKIEENKQFQSLQPEKNLSEIGKNQPVASKKKLAFHTRCKSNDYAILKTAEKTFGPAGHSSLVENLLLFDKKKEKPKPASFHILDQYKNIYNELNEGDAKGAAFAPKELETQQEENEESDHIMTAREDNSMTEQNYNFLLDHLGKKDHNQTVLPADRASGNTLSTARKITKKEGKLQDQEKFSFIDRLKNYPIDPQPPARGEMENKSQRLFIERSRPPKGPFDHDFSDVMELASIEDSQAIRTACFSPDGEYFALGTNSKSLKIYNIKNILQLKSKEPPGSSAFDKIFEKKNHHLGSIYTTDWSQSGRLIASGSNDKSVKILRLPDLEDGLSDEIKLSGHKGIVRCVNFSHDEQMLISAGADAQMKIWDVATGENKMNFIGHTDAIYSFQISGDGKYCVSCGVDKSLFLWDFRNNKPAQVISTKQFAEMNYVSLSDGINNFSLKELLKSSKRNDLNSIGSGLNVAAVAHNDGAVTFWDVFNQKCYKEINLHKEDCRSVEFDPTSNLICTSSFDATICIYDLTANTTKKKILSHSDRVVLAKWHPFYPFLLSTSADKTAKLFTTKEFFREITKGF